MKKNTSVRPLISCLFLTGLLCLLLVWNINSGSVELSVGEIGRILFGRTGEETAYRIVWDIRLPRILAAAILGGALSVSGFLLQTFFSNPIAGPFVLGISSGAKLTVSLGDGYFVLGERDCCGLRSFDHISLCGFHDFHGLCPPDLRKGQKKCPC